MDSKFTSELMKIGIISYKEHETLWEIAQRCAKTAGVPMAGAGFVLGIKAGTVTWPGVGTISGSIAGALAGLVGGTLSCTMLNKGMQDELRQFAQDSIKTGQNN
jgi:hypothetical protein